jgi:hypothetical protein
MKIPSPVHENKGKVHLLDKNVSKICHFQETLHQNQTPNEIHVPNLTKKKNKNFNPDKRTLEELIYLPALLI